MHFHVIVDYVFKKTLFYRTFTIRCEDIKTVMRKEESWSCIYFRGHEEPFCMMGESVEERMNEVILSNQDILRQIRMFIDDCMFPWGGRIKIDIPNEKVEEDHTYEIRFAEQLYICPVHGHLFRGERCDISCYSFEQFDELWNQSIYKTALFRLSRRARDVIDIGRESYYRKFEHKLNWLEYSKGFLSRMWPSKKVIKADIKRAVSRHIRRKKVTPSEQAFFSTLFGASILNKPERT